MQETWSNKKRTTKKKAAPKKVLPICDRKGYKLGAKGGQYMPQEDGTKLWCKRQYYGKTLAVKIQSDGSPLAIGVLPEGAKVTPINPEEAPLIFNKPISSGNNQESIAITEKPTTYGPYTVA